MYILYEHARVFGRMIVVNTNKSQTYKRDNSLISILETRPR